MLSNCSKAVSIAVTIRRCSAIGGIHRYISESCFFVIPDIVVPRPESFSVFISWNRKWNKYRLSITFEYCGISAWLSWLKHISPSVIATFPSPTRVTTTTLSFDTTFVVELSRPSCVTHRLGVITPLSLMSALENHGIPFPQYSTLLVDGVPPPTTKNRLSTVVATHLFGNC